MNKEQAKQILNKLWNTVKDVPEEEFITLSYSNGKDKCCVIGHYNRLTGPSPKDYSLLSCGGLARTPASLDREDKVRGASMNFMPYESNAMFRDITWINNQKDKLTTHPAFIGTEVPENPKRRVEQFINWINDTY